MYCHVIQICFNFVIIIQILYNAASMTHVYILQCRLALKPDGLFLAAILGGETLKLVHSLLIN